MSTCLYKKKSSFHKFFFTMTKILLSTLVLMALTIVLCKATSENSGPPQKRAISGTLDKRTMEECHRTKRQSGTFNWDLNQMFDLFQKVSGGMGGSKRSLNKRQSGTMN